MNVLFPMELCATVAIMLNDLLHYSNLYQQYFSHFILSQHEFGPWLK